MSNGMPISNYNKEDQTLKLSQKEIEPKKAQNTTTNTGSLTNWDYTALGYMQGQNNNPLYRYQTWQAKTQINDIGYTLKGNLITTQTWFGGNSNIPENYGQLYLSRFDGNRVRPQEDVAITKYDNANLLYMFEITPYNINVETTVMLNLNVQIPIETPIGQNNGVKFNLDQYSTIEDWSSYIDSQLTNRKADTILTEINNPNMNYEMQTISKMLDVEYLYNVDNESYYLETIEIPISITPNKTNYHFINLYPLVEYPSNYQDSQILYALQNYITNENNQFSITNTNIVQTGNTEVIDLPGLMFYILTMPFTFVSQAFNLTLFPGTQYQINIANLFLAIIAMLIFIMIIRVLTNQKG